MPAKAGIQPLRNDRTVKLDPGFRRGDGFRPDPSGCGRQPAL